MFLFAGLMMVPAVTAVVVIGLYDKVDERMSVFCRKLALLPGKEEEGEEKWGKKEVWRHRGSVTSVPSLC